MNRQSWHQRIGPGKALLHLYYRPLGRLGRLVEESGPIAVRETEKQRAEKERAAADLYPSPAPNLRPPLVSILIFRLRAQAWRCEELLGRLDGGARLDSMIFVDREGTELTSGENMVLRAIKKGDVFSSAFASTHYPFLAFHNRLFYSP